MKRTVLGSSAGDLQRRRESDAAADYREEWRLAAEAEDADAPEYDSSAALVCRDCGYEFGPYDLDEDLGVSPEVCWACIASVEEPDEQ